MTISEVIAAWTDEYSRAQRTDEAMPHPAGLVELSRQELEATAGGYPSSHTEMCCHCVC